MKRNSKSQRWKRNQAADPYVKAAAQQGFRARSAYKLLDMAATAAGGAPLFRAGMAVVDLGAAPGGWSQVICAQVGKQGCVVAVDLLEMPPLRGAHFIQGDFCTPEVQAEIRTALPPPHHADVVVSDLSPNLTGIKVTDDENIFQLNYAALAFAHSILKPESTNSKSSGAFLFKSFEGEATQRIKPLLRAAFQQVKIIKPDASRKRSSEIYLLAQK